MATNDTFVHLLLPHKYVGKPKLHGGGEQDDRTAHNRENRSGHGAYIKRRSGELSRFWHERRDERVHRGLPLINVGIPFLLEIDPTSNVDFLYGLGFEIVCSISDGFILVASEDADLTALNQKTDLFIEGIKRNCNTPARIFALSEDNDRLKMVLSGKLFSDWVTLQDNTIYTVDIGVSSGGTITMPEQPRRHNGETEQHYIDRYRQWQSKCTEAYMKWDEIAAERQDEICRILSVYDEHEIPDGFIDESDSFSFRLKISGRGLRDFILNYPYIFEVAYAPDINMGIMGTNTNPDNTDIRVIAPEQNAPIICVIDSGVQEGHKYISPAIISSDSICLMPNITDVNDQVIGGGHGTRVVGAILYPNAIPTRGTYQLPCQIRNVRVLDSNNAMPERLTPTHVVETVVKKYFKDSQKPSRIFNHSIGEKVPFTSLKHMSAWAAQIDMQSYEHDVLFVQAAGNIPSEVIAALIKAGHPYPEYLGNDLSRLSNPAQSLQALTVGSVSPCDYETEDIHSMGKEGEISSFSRIGPGIWDTIKPDVVEIGGTHAINKEGVDVILTTPPEVCPELIRRSPPGTAFDRDGIGTSFSAPKVAHVVTEVEKAMPDSSTLLYRALVAQSARWSRFDEPLRSEECQDQLRRFGYGVPDVERATHNNDYRVTLVTPNNVEIGEGEAHIYNVNIPDSLSRVGENFDILIEITLSYAAKPFNLAGLGLQ